MAAQAFWRTYGQDYYSKDRKFAEIFVQYHYMPFTFGHLVSESLPGTRSSQTSTWATSFHYWSVESLVSYPRVDSWHGTSPRAPQPGLSRRPALDWPSRSFPSGSSSPRTHENRGLAPNSASDLRRTRQKVRGPSCDNSKSSRSLEQ